MAARLQEAQFASFDDGEAERFAPAAEGSLGSAGLPTFAVAFPPGVRTQPAKSFARVRSLECTGSGSFYFQNEALKDRFVCWRVIKNVVILREWSLHTSLSQNGVRLEFPAPVVATGVFAVESWEENGVTVNIVTHAGTIHHFTYSVPSDERQSVFSHADAATMPPKLASSVKCDVMESLAAEEIITVALWVNEFNLTLGTDSGRVLGVNFGLPSSSSSGGEVQEFAFSEESMVKWLWHGLLKSRQSDDSRRSSVLAMTCFPIESEDDSEENDVCLVTISADCVLRAWSYGSQSCLGKQQLGEIEGASIVPGADTADVSAVHAKVVALPSTSSDNCRLLVHIDTTAGYSQEIYLVRGDIVPLATNGHVELDLDVARVFTVGDAAEKTVGGNNSHKRLKMVDFAVDKNYLFSAWRSSDGDVVYSHPNPMALTGPRTIQGEPVSSLNDQMLQYQVDDDTWPFDLKEEDIASRIDDFFCERVLLPGRFSRQNLYMATLEYVGGKNGSLGSLFSQLGHQQSKYKELLIRVVSDKWISLANSRSVTSRHAAEPSILRIEIWKELVALCAKHWRTENVPIGFAITTNSLLPGCPVLLRRNRISLLFPSAASITTAFLPQGSSAGAECVRDLMTQVLPAFDAFPSSSFQSFIHREVADIVSEWKVESFVALARHCVRQGLRGNFAGSSNAAEIAPEIQLTRSVLHLSKIIGTDSAFHQQVFRDLVEHLFPFQLWRGHGSFKPASPLKRPDHGYDDEDDEGDEDGDYTMDDASASASAAATGTGEYYAGRRAFFSGNEMCFAFDQVASRTVDAMSNQALRVVLLLSYLVDSRPAFIDSAVLRRILQVHLPKAITIYQRWELSRWIASQNIMHATELDAAATKSAATLLPPLLQLFLRDVNARLSRSSAFKRSLSVLEVALVDNRVQSEQAHSVLATFTRDILQYVSQPNESLVRFLQKRKQFKLLRAMFCCNLTDISLHGSGGGVKHETGYSGDAGDRMLHQYIRSIGECLACEGQVAARQEDKNHAYWCFQQAIRCFNICLSSFFVDKDEYASLRDNDESSRRAAERFVYEAVGVLKQTIPRGFYEQMIGFLWTVATQAFNRAVESDAALQSFVWVNLFKYSVEEQLFRDAHLALMHIMDLAATASASASVSSPLNSPSASGMTNGLTGDEANDEMNTAGECANYLVKELCRYGRLDLVCDLQWGAVEMDVEKQLQWQAANANVIAHGGGALGFSGFGATAGSEGARLDQSVLLHYNLLFAFYSRRQQPANAAAAMYSLALRLRLAQASSPAVVSDALKAQRDALNAAFMALQSLPAQNRWIVRKLHTEELIRSTAVLESAKESAASNSAALHLVSLEDVQREIAVLDGKLRLLRVFGLEESALLSSMSADEVVALLVDAAIQACTSGDGNKRDERSASVNRGLVRGSGSATSKTVSEKRQAATTALELALDIARKCVAGDSEPTSARFANMTKSLARYCVANQYGGAGVSSESCALCWDSLALYLRAAGSLEQYEIAAETILTWDATSQKPVLPRWLYEALSHPVRGNPSKLLSLYLKHGLLLDALALAEESVSASSELLMQDGEVGFQKRAMDAASRSTALPWVSYHLLDAVLDASRYALESGGARDPETAALVRDHERRLRDSLSKYFRLVAALEQARAAAALAQDGALLL